MGGERSSGRAYVARPTLPVRIGRFSRAREASSEPASSPTEPASRTAHPQAVAALAAVPAGDDERAEGGEDGRGAVPHRVGDQAGPVPVARAHLGPALHQVGAHRAARYRLRRTRMAASIDALAAKDAASRTKAQPGPAVRISAPATAGPRGGWRWWRTPSARWRAAARPPPRCRSPVAPRSASRTPTRSRRSASASAMCSQPRLRRRSVPARPRAARRTVRGRWSSATFRASKRSARTPPSGSSTSRGTIAQPRTRASADAEPVARAIAMASAAGTTASPSADRVRPVNSRRKARWRSGCGTGARVFRHRIFRRRIFRCRWDAGRTPYVRRHERCTRPRPSGMPGPAVRPGPSIESGCHRRRRGRPGGPAGGTGPTAMSRAGCPCCPGSTRTSRAPSPG